MLVQVMTGSFASSRNAYVLHMADSVPGPQLITPLLLHFSRAPCLGRVVRPAPAARTMFIIYCSCHEELTAAWLWGSRIAPSPGLRNVARYNGVQ
jgi:hypothetical protein